MFKQILKALNMANLRDLKSRLYISDGVPTCTSLSTNPPIASGELIYDYANAHVYVCTVSYVSGATDAVITAVKTAQNA